MNKNQFGREDEENILSYVHFNILCNGISQFTVLSLDILKEGIAFTLSCSAIDYKIRKLSLLAWRNM